MGIRKKILLGFVAIGFILLLSGVVAIFEMTRLTDLISGLLTNNIQTITSANTIDKLVLRQNSIIRDIVQDEVYLKQTEFSEDISALAEQVNFVTNNITIETEKPWIDKLHAEFNTYSSFLAAFPTVIEQQREQRIVWYESYRKSFISLIEITAEISSLNQDALSENTVKLEGNYYRMIMPAIIAIIAGVFMILFFNYFINSYILNPVIQIKENIKSFLLLRTAYSVKVKTNDDINDLNEGVKDLVGLLKKREKECNSLQSGNSET